MFGGFIKSYYTKSRKGDYTPEDLPKTRWQLFREMLQIRFTGILRLNLMYMLAWLPTMLVIGILLIYVLRMGTAPMIEQLVTNADGTTTTEIVVVTMTEEEIQNQLNQEVALMPSMIHTALMLLVPCIAITGPWTAGVCYVTRNWARDEHAYVWSDMKDAMKANWKPALGLSAITGVLPYLAYLSWEFYGGMAQTNRFMQIPLIGALLLTLLWFLLITYAYPMLVSYNMSFVTILRNSLLLAVGRLPMSVGIRLLLALPVILGVVLTLLTDALWVPLSVFAYYILIGYGLSRFTTASYTNAQFDKYLNSRIEGAQVNRGLAATDDEEYDDEDEEEWELMPWENGYASQDKNAAQ